MSFVERMRAASKVAAVHFLGSVFVAACAAVLVFLIWYPYPYSLLSGGLGLFLILMSVDVVCGPMLTLVLFNSKKSKREFYIDMTLVLLIQVAALGYGIRVVHQARPLFLVHEVDRFRVIGLQDYQGVDVDQMLKSLEPGIRPHWLKGPTVVGTRTPKDSSERKEVLLDSLFGGRDYSQRPDFYVPYDADYQNKAIGRAQNINAFVARYPESSEEISRVLNKYGIALENAKYLPVLHKQEWIAILDPDGRILGFTPGDGFIAP